MLATIPVGVAGLLLEHTVRTVLGRPAPTAVFLIVNGSVLAGAEWLRRAGAAGAGGATAARDRAAVAPAGGPDRGLASDRRLSRLGGGRAVGIGAFQVLAVLAVRATA